MTLVLAGCGHRARAVSATSPTSPIAILASTPSTSASAPAGSAPATSSHPVAAPILHLPTASTSSHPPAPAVPAVSAAQLLGAPVPALCQHSPGRLVNGRLPGIPAHQGVVQLAAVDGYRNHDTMAAFGDLDGDGVSDAAVIMDCDRGGVTSGIGPNGCLNYTTTGKLSVILDPRNDRTLAMTTSAAGAYRTYLGSEEVGAQPAVSVLTKEFPRYEVTTYFKHDFGQGKSGLTVTAPDGSGSIGFILTGAPDTQGYATIAAIRVGKGVNATATAPSCR